jgi:Ca2+-binding RTX toxin-like protein
MVVDLTKPSAQDAISLEELDLYHAITAYREGLGLEAVPLSRALSATAGRHVADLRENVWGAGLELPEGATLHSWSDAPHPADGSAPEVMWDAPARLGTGYASPGYEISAAGFATVGAALEGWIASPAHEAVLANTGAWAEVEFLAMGVGVDTSPGAGPYAGRVFHVWFGEAPDGPPEIVGGAEDDALAGTAFGDLLNGRGGNDAIRGARGDDRLRGEGGDDRLLGGSGDDRLAGGGGYDRLSGAEGQDRLAGGGGDDRLAGGGDDDTLIAGLGRDRLAGGSGADVFRFDRTGGAAPGRPSWTIEDFEAGADRIDLRRLDADASSGADDAFVFVGGGRLREEAGRLRYEDGVLSGDLDGDGAADFEIELAGGRSGPALREDDFLL